MNSESRGITIAFVIQVAVLVVGWMVASLVTRHGQTWAWAEPTFGKWFLHHGLWFAALPVSWLAASTVMASKGSRFATLMFCIVGPALALGLLILVTLAFVSGIGGGSIIGVVN